MLEDVKHCFQQPHNGRHENLPVYKMVVPSVTVDVITHATPEEGYCAVVPSSVVRFNEAMFCLVRSDTNR